jgi:Spy/CpxP family protein refolding chaperone
MNLHRLTLKQLLAIASLAVLLPAMSQAQPSPDERGSHCHEMGGNGPMGEGGPATAFLHGLELTEAQRDAIFNILQNQAPAVRDKQKALHKAFEALRVQAKSDNYDEAKAREQAQAVADSSGSLSLLRARAEHDIYTLLTTEQRKQVDERKGGFRPTRGQSPKACREMHAI